MDFLPVACKAIRYGVRFPHSPLGGSPVTNSGTLDKSATRRVRLAKILNVEIVLASVPCGAPRFTLYASIAQGFRAQSSEGWCREFESHWKHKLLGLQAEYVKTENRMHTKYQ